MQNIVNETREVKIILGQIQTCCEFNMSISIGEIKKWMKEGYFNQLMRQQHEKLNINYNDITQHDVIEIRLNTKNGDVVNQDICLSQFKPNKRIHLNLSIPSKPYFGNVLEGPIKNSSTSVINTVQGQIQQIQISIMNTVGDLEKKLVTVKINDPALKTIGNLEKYLQNQANLSPQTAFRFKNPHNDTIFTDLKTTDILRNFVKINQIKMLHAIPQYTSG